MLNWRKHKVLMVQILKEIYEDKFLRICLGFQGGTACHFFYDLPRYSVDLDFDLIGLDKSENIFYIFPKILNKYGVLKEKRIKRNTIFFLLSYGESEHNLKVEISTRDLGNQFCLKNYLGIAMNVMVEEDMFANKLIALVDRQKFASRDLFDVHYFFSQNWDINEEIIFKNTGKSLEKYLRDCLLILPEYKNKNIMQGLGQLIDEKQKSWVKTKLVDDLIFLIKVYLGE